MADPPYRVGDTAVLLQLEGNTVTVHTTHIEVVERAPDGWIVVDDRANVHEVNDHGEATELVPLDEEIEAELRAKGEGFEVVQEGRLIDPLEPEIAEPSIEAPGLDERDMEGPGESLGR